LGEEDLLLTVYTGTLFYFAVVVLVNTYFVEGQIGKISDGQTRNLIFFIIRYKLVSLPVRCYGSILLNNFLIGLKFIPSKIMQVSLDVLYLPVRSTLSSSPSSST
jgi:hypothetical protein